jgi:HlyD family secretion protein
MVTPGDPIAQIAADEAPLIAKAWLAPQDIHAIEYTQPVQLRISACPYTDYGTLDAKIHNISPDTLPLEVLPGNVSKSVDNSRFYEITLQLAQPSPNPKQNQCNLQAGMTGQADILTREETISKLVWRKLRLTAQI